MLFTKNPLYLEASKEMVNCMHKGQCRPYDSVDPNEGTSMKPAIPIRISSIQLGERKTNSLADGHLEVPRLMVFHH